MSKNLLTVSLDEFSREVHKMSSQSLVSLLKAIYDFKWDRGKMMPYEQMMDIERKETRVNAEMQNRGFLSSKDYLQYFEFLRKINYKKRLF